MIPKGITFLLLVGILALDAPLGLAADGNAKGKVVVDGVPLAAGTISFHRKDGQFVGAKIKGGEYSVDRLPAGKHAVVLQGEGVPDKYSSETTTPLVVEVVEGGGLFDFQLAK